MEKWKELVLTLFTNKPRFVKTMVYIGIGLLFYIGALMAFMKSPELIDGKLSLAKLPGSFIFEAAILLSIVGYFYFILLDNDKKARIFLLIQLIFAQVFHLYGALVFRVGSEGSATGGFGRLFTFLFLVLMWIAYFKESLVVSLIDKYLPKKKLEYQSKEMIEPIEE
jgi:hypothetical protein